MQSRSLTRPRLRSSWLLAIGLGVGLLVLAVRGTDLADIVSTARAGRIDALLLAFAILSASYTLRAYRWGIVIATRPPLAPVVLFWGTMVGYLGNNFLPARAGEVLRSVMLGRKTGLSKSFVLGTALAERVADAVALVVISLVAIGRLDVLPDWLRRGAQVVAAASVIAVVAMLVAPRMLGLASGALGHVPVSEQVRLRALGLIHRFVDGLASFRRPERAARFGALTIVIWLVDAVVAMITAQAFGLTLSLPLALTLLGALGLASAIPSTPGYVGVYQFVAVSLLVPFGYTSAEALVFILALQAVTYATVIVWGLLGLWRLSS
jgi:uncharacterized protein (TIRG00374 family)